MNHQDDHQPNPIEKRILEAIRDIRYGSVEIVIHDSGVVQIEKREKVRIEPDISHTGQPDQNQTTTATDRTSGRASTDLRSSH